MTETNFTIGVLSDTHGSLNNQILDIFSGVRRIIHAGDIDTPDVLDRLNAVAPVSAVRGNMDFGAWADLLPTTNMIQVGEIWIYIIHDGQRLDLDPMASRIHVVISGHTHQPLMQHHKGVLYLNPGSASYARHNHPASIAKLEIRGRNVAAHIVTLT
jgi:putative phosphoesterase